MFYVVDKQVAKEQDKGSAPIVWLFVSQITLHSLTESRTKSNKSTSPKSNPINYRLDHVTMCVNTILWIGKAAVTRCPQFGHFCHLAMPSAQPPFYYEWQPNWVVLHCPPDYDHCSAQPPSWASSQLVWTVQHVHIYINRWIRMPRSARVPLSTTWPGRHSLHRNDISCTSTGPTFRSARAAVPLNMSIQDTILLGQATFSLGRSSSSAQHSRIDHHLLGQGSIQVDFYCTRPTFPARGRRFAR